MPSKRPAYRRNRSHRDFLTDLRPLFDVKTKDQTIDYFDDFKQDDDGKYLAGCEYTELYSEQKNKLLQIQAQIAEITTTFYARPNPTKDENGNVDPIEQQEADEAMRKFKEERGVLQAQIDALPFPNLYTHLKSQQEQYQAHASMLTGMGGVVGADQCQFNDNMVKALENHFDVNLIHLDDIKDVIDTGDGALGTYIIPPH